MLKHLAAAMSGIVVAVMLAMRRPLEAGACSADLERHPVARM